MVLGVGGYLFVAPGFVFLELVVEAFLVAGLGSLVRYFFLGVVAPGRGNVALYFCLWAFSFDFISDDFVGPFGAVPFS